MIKKAALFLFISLILVNMLGCWFIVGGAAGAAGAYAASKDTIQGDTDKPYDSLWRAAQTVSRIRGTIKSEDPTKGYIELQTNSGQVWIALVRLTHATTRIKVSARNMHLPNLGLAQDIYVKIMEEAK